MSLTWNLQKAEQKSQERQNQMPLKKPILKIMDELARSLHSQSNGKLKALIFEFGYDSTSDSSLNDLSYEFSIYARNSVATRIDLFRVIFPQNGIPRFETTYGIENIPPKPIDSVKTFEDILQTYITSERWNNELSRLLDNVVD